MRRTSLVLESLESRLALAAVVTFTDIDGDVVTAKTSKGTNADLATALVHRVERTVSWSWSISRRIRSSRARASP